MQIDLLKLTNFRAFSELEIEFSPNFNILVGDNMTGKTSILEALSIATASFFLGIDGVDTRHIQKEDIRLEFSAFSFQYSEVGVIACAKITADFHKLFSQALRRPVRRTPPIPKPPVPSWCSCKSAD